MVASDQPSACQLCLLISFGVVHSDTPWLAEAAWTLPLRSLGCGKWPGLCWFAIFHCRLVRFGDSCEHWEHLTAAVRQGETHQQICRPDLACLCMWLDTIPILPVRIIFSFFVWLVSVLIFGWSNLCAWNEVSACMSLRVGILACCTSDVKDGDVSWKMMVLTCW